MHRRKFLATSAALSAIPFVPALAKGDGLAEEASATPRDSRCPFVISGRDSSGKWDEVIRVEVDEIIRLSQITAFVISFKMHFFDSKDWTAYSRAAQRFASGETFASNRESFYLHRCIGEEIAYRRSFSSIVLPNWVDQKTPVAAALSDAMTYMCWVQDFRSIEKRNDGKISNEPCHSLKDLMRPDYCGELLRKHGRARSQSLPAAPIVA